jgi:membrane protein DedA with SNARE-associated domain
LLVGRFIPFGVRNGLLLTAGLGRMSFVRLATVDLVAATLSCGFYFWLYFTYGRAAVSAVAESQLALFIAVGAVVALLLARRFLWRKVDAG